MRRASSAPTSPIRCPIEWSGTDAPVVRSTDHGLHLAETSDSAAATVARWSRGLTSLQEARGAAPPNNNLLRTWFRPCSQRSRYRFARIDRRFAAWSIRLEYLAEGCPPLMTTRRKICSKLPTLCEEIDRLRACRTFPRYSMVPENTPPRRTEEKWRARGTRTHLPFNRRLARGGVCDRHAAPTSRLVARRHCFVHRTPTSSRGINASRNAVFYPIGWAITLRTDPRIEN